MKTLLKLSCLTFLLLSLSCSKNDNDPPAPIEEAIESDIANRFHSDLGRHTEQKKDYWLPFAFALYSGNLSPVDRAGKLLSL